jgi:hypothetical protein
MQKLLSYIHLYEKDDGPAYANLVIPSYFHHFFYVYQFISFTPFEALATLINIFFVQKI